MMGQLQIQTRTQQGTNTKEPGWRAGELLESRQRQAGLVGGLAMLSPALRTLVGMEFFIYRKDDADTNRLFTLYFL